MSDLRTNNVRGYLAEYLVALAVGAAGVRVEWDPWDVTTPGGTRIEVKASGYLQSWAQTKLSSPRFQVRPAFAYDSAANEWSKAQDFNAQVYVFCLHTAKTHEAYDPLSVDQWVFYVADRSEVRLQAGASMSLGTLSRLVGDPVTYEELGPAIARAASRGNT